MLYALFFIIAISFNWFKFKKDKKVFLSSLIDAKSTAHREMILGHHFYIFIFECYLGFIVAHLISEGSLEIGLLGLGLVYLALLFMGFVIYQFFVVYVEKLINIDLRISFRKNLVKEIRINLALVIVPILIYSLINLTFQDQVFEEWGNLWFLGILFNILFVSVLTISCTVIIMLKLIPNREITEDFYLELINRRLNQIGKPNIRLRWIEADVKNAFVVGLKLFHFTNQTMFIGRNLRELLTIEEFDAVVCHELSHVANGHISKRLIDFIKNFVSIIVGSIFIVLSVMILSFFIWGEEAVFQTTPIALSSTILVLSWFVFNYALLFDTIRSHEFEADGFAVMKLGVGYEHWKSAIIKLSHSDDLPDYLKLKNPTTKKISIFKQISSQFSTHPKIEERISFLSRKIDEKLAFNFYVSSAHKIRMIFWNIFQLRVLVSLLILSLLSISWIGLNIYNGSKLITWISSASAEQILNNPEVRNNLNSSPTFIGPKLSYYLIKKNDPLIVEYLFKNDVSPGRILLYLTEFKSDKLFEKYYSLHSENLSEEEYFLILRKAAQVNFVKGYRSLVNSSRFEMLDESYKSSVSKILELKRSPASIKR